MSCSTYHSDTGEDISTKGTVKDLGVLLSNELTYKSHIQRIVNKVKIISSWIYRMFKTREQSTMLTLWKSLRLLLATMVTIKKISNARFGKTTKILSKRN